MSQGAPMPSTPDGCFQFTAWKHEGLRHAVTGRRSLGSGDFNLSFHTGDVETVEVNRRSLQEYLGANSLFIPRQCHGKRVVKVTSASRAEELYDTDALVTNEQGIAIGVLGADCVPLLFWDPVKKAIGAAHAGWKGTVAAIATETVRVMQRSYGSRPEDIRVAIGPSISAQHFEVGEEVARQFSALDLDDCILSTQGEVKPRIDLWNANRQLLLRAGIAPAHIETAAVCTFSHTGDFYSARKEGFGTGRFGAFILLQPTE